MKKTSAMILFIFLLATCCLYGEVTQRLLDFGHFLIEDGKILMRTFYEEDSEGRIVSRMIDDGIEEDPFDLTGVTLRLIEKVSISNGIQEVSHYYLDLESGAEVPLHHHTTRFDAHGNPLEEIFNDTFFRMTFRDDATIEQHDSTGRAIAIEKDAEGHFLAVHDSAEFFHTGSVTEKVEEGVSLSHSEPNITLFHHQDGRETLQHYDAQGRPTLTLGPALPDCAHPPRTENRYDAQGNLIYRRIPDGKTWKSEYNDRHQPLWRSYPDGTEERFSYESNGMIASTTNRFGITHKYVRDGLGRPINTEIIDRNATPLYSIETEYCLAGPQRILDSRGTITLYRYDGAGRMIEKEVKGLKGELLEQERYQYGKYGEREAKIEGFGKEERWTWYERDAGGVLSGFRIENCNGKALASNPIKKQERPNIETVLETNGTLTKTLTLSEKNQIRTYDSCGQMLCVEEWTSDGTLLSRTHHRYHPNRHTLEEERIVAGEHWGSVVTEQILDEHKRVIAITEDAEGEQPSTTNYSYNEWGEHVEEIKPDGTVLYYSYDGQGNLISRKSSIGDIEETFSYDLYGNLIACKNQHGITQRTYDQNGNLIQELSSHGLNVTRSYDSLGRCIALTLPDQSQIRYHYDAAHLRQIERVATNTQPSYQHNYESFDWYGRLLTSTLACGTGTLSYEWNSDLHAPTHINSPFWQQHARYDDAGRIEQLLTTDIFGTVDQHFVHDAQHHLMQEISSTEAEITERQYRYDSLDNRIAKNRQELKVNGHHQLLFDGEFHYSYDLNGNLISKKNQTTTTHLTYDSRDRLTSITVEDAYRVLYQYDPLNRVITETRYDWGEKGWTELATQLYLYDGLQNIGTCNSKGELLQLRIASSGDGEPDRHSCVAIEICEEGERQTYIPIHDLFGSITCLVDAEGKIVQTYRYDPFGSPTAQFNRSETTIPWGFSGKRWDSKTQLSHFGNRLYDPLTARWLSKDPVGRTDGPNRYAYVHHDPLHYHDPYGLWSVRSWIDSAFSKIKDSAKDFWKRLTMTPYHANYYLLEDLFPGDPSLEKRVDTLTEILETGPVTGFCPQESLSGVVGKGEISDKIRVTFINGIFTDKRYLPKSAELLSATHGDVNIHYIFRSSRGIQWDLTVGGLVRVFDYTSQEAYMLAEKWKALIAEMGGPDNEGLIIHYAHSLGAADSIRAKEMLSKEERKMIRIITLGSPRMVHGEDFESVVNYVSVRDGICLCLDTAGVIRALWSDGEEVVFLGGLLDGVPFFDHDFQNTTYRAVWENLGAKFVEMFGSVK